MRAGAPVAARAQNRPPPHTHTPAHARSGWATWWARATATCSWPSSGWSLGPSRCQAWWRWRASTQVGAGGGACRQPGSARALAGRRACADAPVIQPPSRPADVAPLSALVLQHDPTCAPPHPHPPPPPRHIPPLQLWAWRQAWRAGRACRCSGPCSLWQWTCSCSSVWRRWPLRRPARCACGRGACPARHQWICSQAGPPGCQPHSYGHAHASPHPPYHPIHTHKRSPAT